MIVASLQQLAAKLGRSPTSREVNEASREECPAADLCRIRFGTFNHALQAAGLDPRPVGFTVANQAWDKRRWVVPAIDPLRAAAITEAKKAFWENGGRLTSWVHPYSRRAQARPQNDTRRTA